VIKRRFIAITASFGLRFLSLLLCRVFRLFGLLRLLLFRCLFGSLLFFLCINGSLFDGDIELEISLELFGGHLVGSVQVFIIRDVNHIILSVSVLDGIGGNLGADWFRLQLLLHQKSQGLDGLWQVSDSLYLRVSINF
jgi:hypothetical protein